ncbi:MAG: hypothetical protein ABIL49_01335 [candidate division WOR-3 bacterium]
MSFKRGNSLEKPLSVVKINDNYILAIYKGKKSKADILIRYRQKLKNNKWSNIRTPKHIHWIVDILMKLSREPELTKKFLDTLMNIWDTLKPLNEKTRDKLKLEDLFKYDNKILNEFRELSKYGEYNIKFLILLAKLLMIQEKTNYPKGKIFQKLIEKLKEGEDLFSILQIATLRKMS